MQITWDTAERIANSAATIGGILFAIWKWGRQVVVSALQDQIKPLEKRMQAHEQSDEMRFAQIEDNTEERHQQNLTRLDSMEKNQDYQIKRLDTIVDRLGTRSRP